VNHAVVINVTTLQHWTFTLPGNDINSTFWWTPDSAHIVVLAGQVNVAVYDLQGHLVRPLSLGEGAVTVDSAFGLPPYYCPISAERVPMAAACVSDIWTGKFVALIPLPRPQPGLIDPTVLGLYDQSHVYGWAGDKIVVRDFRGRVVRVLAVDHWFDSREPPQFYFTHTPQPAGT
jgi:hypothetical protein